MYGTRFTDKYLLARQAANRSSYSYSYGSHLPSRTTIKPVSAPIISSGTSASPPRKVVTDFAAFGAPKNASVFGTAVASTPFSLAGGRAAFGGIRNPGGKGGLENDDDDDDDEGKQKIELREDSISLDQVLSRPVFLSAMHTDTDMTGTSYRNAECLEGRPRITDSRRLARSTSYHNSRSPLISHVNLISVQPLPGLCRIVKTMTSS